MPNDQRDSARADVAARASRVLRSGKRQGCPVDVVAFIRMLRWAKQTGKLRQEALELVTSSCGLLSPGETQLRRRSDDVWASHRCVFTT